jgi:hypothetical protein
MIPLPVILAEIIMALGGALFGANAYALYRTRKGAKQGGDDMQDRPQGPQPGMTPPRVQARGRVVINMLIGLVVFVWGLATFIVRLHTKA